MMYNIWEKYGYKEEMKAHALGEAFHKHITYLRSLDAEPQPELYPPKNAIWWKNKEGVWERL